ncbi:MAG TPA: hypothetical protein EYP04_04130 [Anaerolineae bacterium]|nr:hypothetical protein [Anaerolineae bacterium]HIQ05160.1 hypothetical protein [Anaerolineae bacterium]
MNTGDSLGIFPCETVWLGDDGRSVHCQNSALISAGFDENGDLRYEDDAYHVFTIFNTSGLVDISRWNVGEQVDRGHTSERHELTWYVNAAEPRS